MKVKQFWVLHFYIERKLFIWPSLRQQRAARQEECLAIVGAEILGDELRGMTDSSKITLLLTYGGVKLFAENLRKQLSELAERYAKKRDLPFDPSPGGVVIFKKDENKNIHGNFLDSSYRNILKKQSWRVRLDKPHPSPPDRKQEVKELDSCNSSDALLMNIFCHPGIDKWKSLKKLLGLSEIGEPEFGFLGKVKKNSGQDDTTEIDMKLDGILMEAKLTEKDFTKKEKRIVESYDNFKKVFNEELLPQSSEDYLNYQLIRNILAAYQRNLSFLLLCDARRPDLVKEFYSTARCVRDDRLRVRCNIVFWQEIAQNVGKELRDFLVEKYGFQAA